MRKIKLLFLSLLFTLTLNAQISKLLIGNKSVSSATYEYFITSDGDTAFTSDGDTMKVKISFNKRQEKREDENIINDNSLFAVLFERKRTMEFSL